MATWGGVEKVVTVQPKHPNTPLIEVNDGHLHKPHVQPEYSSYLYLNEVPQRTQK